MNWFNGKIDKKAAHLKLFATVKLHNFIEAIEQL